MSTIKSSAENLTLNADGANNDIKFQSNGSEVASIDQAGTITATSFAGSGAALTGVGVDGIVSNADATAITINSSEQVGIGTTSPNAPLSVLASSNANAIRMYGRSDGYSELYGSSNDGSTNNAFLQVGTDQTKLYTLAAKPLLFGTNSTERVRIHSSGVMSVPNGIELGSGLDATAANTLDDYEEGTWTPAWNSDGGTIVTNTTYTGGVYTKVGNLVTVQCRLYTNNVSSPTGKITISGLPYTIKNSPYATPYVTWPLLGLNGSLAGEPRAKALGNTTTLQLSDWVWGTTESGSNIADKFDADVWCHAGLTYMTN
jgi:hypothetical protein